jgi:hypothetical protein
MSDVNLSSVINFDDIGVFIKLLHSL